MYSTKASLIGVTACAFLAGCSTFSQSSSPSPSLQQSNSRKIAQSLQFPATQLVRDVSGPKKIYVANCSGFNLTTY
jgi:uncharacterized lipoprotein